MKCPNCGAELPDDAAFCMICGAPMEKKNDEVKEPELPSIDAEVEKPVEPLVPEKPVVEEKPEEMPSVEPLPSGNEVPHVEEPEPVKQEPVPPVDPGMPVPPVPPKPPVEPGKPAGKKPIPKKLIIISAVAVVAIVACIAGFLYFGSFVTVHLITDNLSAAVTGGNNYGTVAFNGYGRDMSELVEKYSDKASQSVDDLSNLDWNALADSASDYADIYAFESSIVYNVEYPKGKENGTLSNGDVIKITAEYDEDLAKELHITVKDTEYEYTVEGLADLVEVDLFEGLEVGWGVSYYGSTPTLQVEQTSDDELLQNISYYTEEVDDTTVEVTASIDEESLISQGYIAKDNTYTKTYDVGQRPIPITSLDGEGVEEAYRQEAEKVATAYQNMCSKIYVEGNPVTISSYTVTEIDEGWSGIDAEVTYTLSDGRTYTTSYDIMLYRMGDDSISSLMDYEFDNDSCELSKYSLDD